MKTIKKSVTKKTVAKKPIMKMGGAKKNLKKAQYGRQQGPLTEADTKFLDRRNNMDVPTPYSSNYDRKKIANTPSNQEYYASGNADFRKSMEEDLREGFVPEGMYSSFEQKKGGSMKTIKKYQKGSEVKGSKGAKASQIIAGISAAAAGAAGIGKNISNRRKAKKAAEEKAKMEAAGKMKYGGAKKPLRKAQYGTELGKSTTKTNMFGRTIVTTPETGTWRDGSTSKGISKTTYDSKGNYLKNKTKSTSTFPDGDNQTIVVKNKKGQNNTFGNVRKGIVPVKKTGGMVNSNTKVTALKSAGSKGVKSGVNSKVSASKVAKGRTGGTSSAPKTATPKAKMGGNMKKKSC